MFQMTRCRVWLVQENRLKRATYGFIMVTVMFIIFTYNAELFLKKHYPPLNRKVAKPSDIWSQLPSMAIIVRTYSAMFDEILRFMFTFEIFWPRSYRPKIVWVFDDEREIDHQLATLLLHTSVNIEVAFEALPGQGILSNVWRSIGYCRQQYSNFYSDKYTNATYIAIMDSDAFFVKHINPDELFARSTGLPILMGYNARSPWCPGADFLIGKKCIGEFMVNFPVIVKRTHFQDLRQHVIRHLNVSSFEEAFHLMLRLYGRGGYSQFNIIATYLWYYKHADYTWHINSCGRLCHHPRRPVYQWELQNGRNTSDALMAKKVFEYNIPISRYTKHGWHSGYLEYVPYLFDSICISSDYHAGECSRHRSPNFSQRDNIFKNWYTDRATFKPSNKEAPWISPSHSNFIANAHAVVNQTVLTHGLSFRKLDLAKVTYIPYQVKVVNRAFIAP